VSAPFEDLIQQLRSGIGDGRMLLKVNGTGHMYRKAYHSGQPIQTNGIPCYGQSVGNSELSCPSTRFNSQFLSNSADKRCRSVFHG
jgi:hypothetical protein